MRKSKALSWILTFAVGLEAAALPPAAAAQQRSSASAGAASEAGLRDAPRGGSTSSPAVPGTNMSQAPKVGAADREAEAAVRISPGDVVSITVYPATEYSREVTVQPDGKIELALIGSVLVKGLSPRELQDLLREKYSRYVERPEVTVATRKFAGRRVAILGEARSPGFYEYRDGMRLLELLSLAGGLTDNAKPRRSRILRYGGDGAGLSLAVNLEAVLDGDAARNVPLAPGDTVYIPKGRFTFGAQWANTNILPWLTLLTSISTIVLLVHSNTQ